MPFDVYLVHSEALLWYWIDGMIVKSHRSSKSTFGANKQIQRQMQSVRHKRLLHIFVWVRLNPPVQWGLFKGQLLLDFLIENAPGDKNAISLFGKG